MAAVAVPGNGVVRSGALGQIKAGRVEKAPRVLLYSREKIGKTGFAAGAPNPIFLCSEMGTEEYDVARAAITDWTQLGGIIDALTNEPHDYKTLVIDTLDHLEAVLHRHIIANDEKGKTSMVTAAGGFGKAFKIATESFRKLAAKFDIITERRRMNVVLLAHAHIKKFNDPQSDGWDQYRLKMHEEAAGFWREWVDAVLFANLDIAVKESDSEKTRAKGTGDRFIYTVPPRDAAFEAGNRFALPPKIKLRWSSFEEALRASNALRSELAHLVAKLPAEKRAAAQQKATEAKDYDSLKEIVDKARGMVAPPPAVTAVAPVASTPVVTNVTSEQKEISK